MRSNGIDLEAYTALEAKYKDLEEKYNLLKDEHISLKDEHAALKDEHAAVQEELEAHTQLAEDLEDQLKDSEELRNRTRLQQQRETQRSIIVANQFQVGQQELKEKQKKLLEIEDALLAAKAEGEEGKKKAQELVLKKQLLDRDLKDLSGRLNDKSDHLRLLKEQQMYYEEEIAEYARLARTTKRQMIILTAENRRLKPQYANKKKKKREKNTAELALEKMRKNKQVMDKMKDLMEDAFAPPKDGNVGITTEEREKRKVIIKVITKMMVHRNGYSATDPFEKRMWLKLRKNMNYVTVCMKTGKPKRRRGSKGRRGSVRKSSVGGSPVSKSPGRSQSHRSPPSSNRSPPTTTRKNSFKKRRGSRKNSLKNSSRKY